MQGPAIVAPVTGMEVLTVVWRRSNLFIEIGVGRRIERPVKLLALSPGELRDALVQVGVNGELERIQFLPELIWHARKQAPIGDYHYFSANTRCPSYPHKFWQLFVKCRLPANHLESMKSHQWLDGSQVSIQLFGCHEPSVIDWGSMGAGYTGEVATRRDVQIQVTEVLHIGISMTLKHSFWALMVHRPVPS